MPGRGISQQRDGLHARCAKTGIYPSNVLERVYARGQAAMASTRVFDHHHMIHVVISVKR